MHATTTAVRDFRDAPGRTAKFLNNRIDCSTGHDTGALFIQPTWLPIHNAFVEGNYLEGGGYNLYVGLDADGRPTRYVLDCELLRFDWPKPPKKEKKG